VLSFNTGTAALPVTDIVAALNADDFIFIESGQVINLLSAIAATPIGNDQDFLDSWNRLEQDQYMADGGKYRKRRHATYAILNAGEPAQLMPYQPHYQTVDYNPLNGGVARYFAPILDDLHDSTALAALLEFGNMVFSQITGNHSWHIELHQFRIEARDGKLAKPTPEGVHRDGVDLGEFTLRESFDMVLVNDRRVYHGVTPITPLDPAAEAFRDVLVITFKNRESV
jgi:hypothetical protein